MLSFSGRIILFVSYVFLLACNKTSTTPNANNETKVIKQETTVYPHSTDILEKHGGLYLKAKSQCLACHGEDGGGGNTKVACLKCHDFPHPREWVMPNQHPVQYYKNSQSCVICHGADLKGGVSKVGCSSCHESYPHPQAWAVPTAHGVLAAKDSKDCMNCHDPAKKKSITPTCQTCHEAYPHPKNFSGTHKNLASKYSGKCLVCHRDYKENMPTLGADGGCIACHDGTIDIKWLPSPPTPTAPAPTVPPGPGHTTIDKKIKRHPSTLPKK